MGIHMWVIFSNFSVCLVYFLVKKKRISQKAAGIERRDGFGTGTQIPTVYGGWGGRGTSQVALVGSNPLPTQVT